MRNWQVRNVFLPFGAGSRECLGRQFAAGQVRVVFSATLLDLVTDHCCLHGCACTKGMDPGGAIC